MAAAEEEAGEEGQWDVKFREDEELQFYTELALHETERWISSVTKQSFSVPEDPRKSLENGILLCELLNTLKPGSVKRINKLPTPIAGLDNLNVFLKACKQQFGLNDTQLFDPSDLEDLSQRAIADSEHLKEEVDRRLRNVAITVYWIGRVAAQNYQGPRIDESAFAALVHNHHRHREHIVSDGQLRKDSACSWDANNCHSSAYGSREGNRSSRGSVKEPGETSAGPRHVRDGSFDSYTSYGKGSEDSLDEFVFEVDENGMPIPRYSSSSALNQSTEGSRRTSERDSSMYSSDKNSGLYRSSPDLTHGSLSKRRSSSTDSTDGSHGGSHSRQSSDSLEYPTRRLSSNSSNTSRRTSVSADPLQFIKLKGANDLAYTAEEQMKMAAESKRLKFVNSVTEEESNDWQSHLTSWKNRRKSHSEKSYQLKEELEEMEREKEQPKITATQTTKTFSQMQEEREQRKLAGPKYFYPIEDEGEDDIFGPDTAKQKESTPAGRSSSRSQSSVTSKEDTKDTKVKSRTKDNVAKWTQDSASDGEGEGEQEKTKKESVNNSHTTSTPPSETRASRFSRDSSENSVPRQRRSGLPEHHTQDKRDSWQTQYSEPRRDNAFKENNRNSANSSLPARSSGKISNIMKTFEQKEEEAKAKPSVNSSVDVGARKKPFENTVGRSGDVDSYRSWSIDRDKDPVKGSSRTEMTTHSSSAVYSSTRNSGKDYVEKTIKISQKPNNDKGFGFILSGGADKKQPVVVEKVGLGSAADVCELQMKDEVISINGQNVARLTSVELTQKVQDSVKTGQIELRVKRFLGSGDDMEDEEDFLSTDEDVDTPDRSISKSSSIRAENSFDSLDSRDGPQKAEEELERPWMTENIAPITKTQNNRRGDPTSTSSDSGYDAQTFSPYHRGDNSSNEEELTSSQQQQVTESRARPSLGSRMRGLYPRDEDEQDYVNVSVTQTSSQSSYKHEFSDKGLGKEVSPPGEIEVESRPSITVRRERVNVSQKQVRDDDSKPAATSEARYEATSVRREEKYSEQTASEDSDSGPPAALRKWQRQRPRVEYAFESDDSPKFYDQMKISSPRRSEKQDESKQEETASYKSSEDTDDTISGSAPVVSSRRGLRLGNDKDRIRNWNQKQEEERQPADHPPTGYSEAPVEITSPYEQQRFTTEREQIRQQYQHDLQRAANSEQQKQEEEKKMLEPEMEKMRLLEERRAQRQARLKMYAQDLNAEFPPPASSALSSSSSRSSPAPPRAPEPAFSESQVLDQQQQQQHTSTFTTQISNGKSVAGPPEVLIIDPRNRGDGGDPGQPIQFQVKINSRETPQGLLIQPEVIPTQHSAPPPLHPHADHAAFLEAERERIRQEELQRIEAERLQREDDERRHIREKEERLRQQEEMLRQQQEELRLTQERLEQERQQLLQQQQHRTAAMPPQQSDYHSSQNAAADSLQFETVTSKVRGSSPVYTSTIIAGPRRSEGRPQTAQSQVDPNQESYGVRRSEPSWSSGRPQTASSWRGNVQTVASSQSQLPKWPPSGADQGRNTTMPPQGTGAGQYSREDMMVMNRKATPLQGKAPSPNSAAADLPEAPMKREAPSKSQIHSLNSVPKARVRQSDQWMGSEGGGADGRPQPGPPRRSDAHHRSQFTGSQDHWLIQEAERRRLNENSYGQNPSRPQFSGPIKPATDNYGNRWREGGAGVRLSPNMPAQIRQTLLQKTAGARGSTASNSSQEMIPPGPGHAYQPEPAGGFSQTLPPNFGYGGSYPPNARPDSMPPQHQPPSSGDPGANISGKQRCSHCNQELGFGAAMVIESLGLYYHTQCFKCCVCRTPLGSGVEGADVRVRVNKLHCPNCYSNDEAGLKFSKV